MKRKHRKPEKRRKLKGPIHGRILALRLRRGLSQSALAATVGVKKTAVSHWENRVARPDISRLSVLASSLHTSIRDLVDGEDWPAVESLLDARARAA